MPVSKPSQDDKEPIDDAALASILGSLLWLSLRTRPDISWAVSRWTLDFALVYSGHHEGNTLDVYTDASWSPTGEKSHSGLCTYYRGNLVAWNSKRQSLTALSPAEAELIACVSGAQLGLSLRTQLEEMMQMKIDLVLYCDNAAVTQLVSHLNASSTRTRHLSMRGAWLHDLHQRQALSLFFIDTHEQKADALTK
eukprot:1959524-Amphidinium_carterae.1